MSKSAISVFVFGIYLCLIGPALVFVPNVLLSLFAIPGTSEVWIRVLGAVVLVLGYYYVQAARHGLTDFFRATVPGRVFVLISFAVFVWLDLAAPMLILFGVVDSLGALWTALALRSESH